MEQVRERVVVGVDGSEHAARALQWATRHAGPAQVEVVAAWTLFDQLHHGEFDPEWNEAKAKEFVDGFVDATLGADRPDDLIITVINDLPTAAILSRAKEADWVVVGSRGRGGFSGLVLGSVSSQVVHHAGCPVAVVPGPPADKH